jgi:murein DD-endopeptidase MepM/ murein hydrolase activator NlpD
MAASKAPVVEPPPFTTLETETVLQGDHMGAIFQRLGLPDSLLYPFVHCYDQMGDHRRLHPGEKLALESATSDQRLWLSHWPRPETCYRVGFPLGVDSSQSYQALTSGFQCQIDSIQAIQRIVVLEGEIESSLYTSVMEANGSPALVLAFSDICQWDVNFLLDVRRGDRFQLLVERLVYRGEWLTDSLVREGRILAATYFGQRDSVQASWFSEEDHQGYFDSEGQSFQKQFLRSPLNFRRISSTYGNRRHPISKRVRLHAGVDFAAPSGTPVVAAADGKITYVGWKRGYGNVVKIRHTDRYETLYGHLKGFAKGMRKGRRIAQNELIAYVGSTGISTGPHLHYEFIINGKSVDPLRIVNQPTDPLPEHLRAAHQILYDERMAALDVP